MAHGGVIPEVGPRSVEALNDSLRAFMAEDLFYQWADTTVALVTDSVTAELVRDQYSEVIVMDSAAVARRTGLLFDEESIFWFRGYVEADTLGTDLDRVLNDYGAELHVVAHTPVRSYRVAIRREAPGRRPSGSGDRDAATRKRPWRKRVRAMETRVGRTS